MREGMGVDEGWDENLSNEEDEDEGEGEGKG